MRILIAEAAPNAQFDLRKALSGHHTVRLCEDGRSAIHEVLDFIPDLIVVDLLLPVMDGLSLLQNLHTAGKMPKVLVLTHYISEHIQDMLMEMGVCHLLIKPCSLQNVLLRIADILSQEGIRTENDDLRHRVKRLLLNLGLRTDLSGYRYVIEAIMLLDNSIEQSITKDLYPAVAGLCGGNWQQAERAIRLCIQDAWKRRDTAVWALYFGRNRFGDISRVSNSSFFHAVLSFAKKENQDDRQKAI